MFYSPDPSGSLTHTTAKDSAGTGTTYLMKYVLLNANLSAMLMKCSLCIIGSLDVRNSTSYCFQPSVL